MINSELIKELETDNGELKVNCDELQKALEGMEERIKLD